MFVTPGVVVDGKLVTNDLVDINLGIRILLGSSYYDDWEDQEMFVTNDPLGNPVDRRHPWNQHTNPHPQKRDLDDKYSWVMSPRWYDGRTISHWTPAAARSPGCGPRRSPGWSTWADTSRRPAAACRSTCRRRRSRARSSLEWKIPVHVNTLERNRARTYFQAYAAGCALYFAEKALEEIRAGRTKTWEKFEVPDEGIGCGFTEAVRGVLSHHMVIRDGKIANYHPYPPTPWNASPTRFVRDGRAVRGRRPGPTDLRGERPGSLQGHRRDAYGAQLRSVPAVRRTHVSRRGQEARGAALADPVAHR